MLDEKQTSCTIKLDWDFVTIAEVRERIKTIKHDKNLLAYRVFLSARKGFHCVLLYKIAVPVLKTRRRLCDDGRRLVFDMLRPLPVHSVLWKSKTLYKNGESVTFFQEEITEWIAECL